MANSAYRPEMAHGDRESDGERSRSTDPGSVRVTRSKDRHHQHESTEHLNAEDLSERNVIITWPGRTDHVPLIFVGDPRQTFENSSADDCTNRLHDHVEYRSAYRHSAQVIHLAETFINAIFTAYLLFYIFGVQKRWNHRFVCQWCSALRATVC